MLVSGPNSAIGGRAKTQGGFLHHFVLVGGVVHEHFGRAIAVQEYVVSQQGHFDVGEVVLGGGLRKIDLAQHVTGSHVKQVEGVLGCNHRKGLPVGCIHGR